MVFCGVITGCYFCCCCFCFCCNFCCGKFKHVVEEEPDFENIYKYEEASSDDEKSAIITEEPQAEKDSSSSYTPGMPNGGTPEREKTAFAMPPPTSYESVSQSDKDVSSKGSSSPDRNSSEGLKIGAAIPMPPP